MRSSNTPPPSPQPGPSTFTSDQQQGRKGSKRKADDSVMPQTNGAGQGATPSTPVVERAASPSDSCSPKRLRVEVDAASGEIGMEAAASSIRTEESLLPENGQIKQKIKSYPATPVINAALYNALIDAIDTTDEVKVRALLEAGVDPDFSPESENKPVVFAIDRYRYDYSSSIEEIMTLLVSYKADPALAYEQTTLLHLATERNWIGLFKKLVDLGVDMNAPDDKGATPLLLACANENCEIAEFLIKGGANVNIFNKQDKSPLRYACKRGLVDIAKLLLEYGHDKGVIDCYGDAPIHIACDNYECAKLLVDSGADTRVLNKDGYSPLILACFHGNAKVFELLKNKTHDSQSALSYGLYWALANDMPLKVIEGLFELGVDVNGINQYNATPLGKACEKGCMDTVDVLLREGADTSASDEDGATPLTHAINPQFVSRNEKETLQLVQNLLVEGANANKPGRGRLVPENQARLLGYDEVADCLKAKASSPDKLQNIARLALREHLRKVKKLKLQKSNEQLPLPESLKQFVLKTHHELQKLNQEKEMQECSGGNDDNDL